MSQISEQDKQAVTVAVAVEYHQQSLEHPRYKRELPMIPTKRHVRDKKDVSGKVTPRLMPQRSKHQRGVIEHTPLFVDPWYRPAEELIAEMSLAVGLPVSEWIDDEGCVRPEFRKKYEEMRMPGKKEEDDKLREIAWMKKNPTNKQW